MTGADRRPAREPEPEGAWRTLVRGLRLSPELRRGLGLTLLAALVATAGRVVAPVAVQLTIDRGVQAPGGPRLDLVAAFAAGGLGALALASCAGALMNVRLVTATERALSALRVRTFAHLHDLSVARHRAEQRGALVARVTADIDQISRFMQWGGVMLVVNLGQLVLATAVMLVYSWPLALVVVAAVAPLGVVLRWFQRRLSAAYLRVRRRVGALLGVLAEAVVGVPVIRAYGIEARTEARLDDAIDGHVRAGFAAARLSAVMFSSGELFAAVALAGVVALGVVLGAGGDLTTGQLVAFMFLVNLFVGPVQVATEVLDQAQTAIAGWRRVLDVLDVPAEVADPARSPAGARPLPAGPLRVAFEGVGFAYPAADGGSGPLVLRDVDLEIDPGRRVAVVGETGSGKSTFALLLARLADPTRGRVTLNGVPLDAVPFDALRRRVLLVPQDGFLFDTTIEANVRTGRPSATTAEIAAAFAALGIGDWLAGLPRGLATPVGERGEQLSVGERQLVALARAFVADPDLLVLDEATSAVDPATEARLQRALEELTRGRTSVAIAHRLSTAEAADEVLVFDRGRVADRGSAAELLTRPGPYRRLHASWADRRRQVG